MAQYRYATKIENEDKIAKAAGREMPISTKQAIEVCNFIRKKSVEDARAILQKVVEKKMAVPFRIYTGGAGHKKGIGPGKYPINCCAEILALLNSAAANASSKGLNPSSMIISSLCAQGGGRRWHYGRQRRRLMKRTNLEIVITEVDEKKEAKKTKKTADKKEKQIQNKGDSA